jgi:hypothetical protein
MENRQMAKHGDLFNLFFHFQGRRVDEINFILFGIMKNGCSSGRNLLLYVFIKKGDKTDYRGTSQAANYIPNFIQYYPLKVNYIHRQNYWG